MYNFENALAQNEKILYQGRPVPGKGKKNSVVLLFIITFLIIVEVLLVCSLKEFFSFTTLFISFGFLIVIIIFMYAFIYEQFLKKRNVADDFYCLTTERVLKYESSKNILVFGYLSKYEKIETLNVKDNYGDVEFKINYNQGNQNLTKENWAELKEMALNPDKTDMPQMLFESVENPNLIANMAIEARQELLKK